MRISTAAVAALFVALVSLAGCTTKPIMNVSSVTITTASGQTPSREQVRAAILRAGAAQGWQFKDEGPNLLIGTLNMRTHTAVVEIPYSPSSYSIKYRSSINLGEQDGNIHKQYNAWVQKLNQSINSQLTAS